LKGAKDECQTVGYIDLETEDVADEYPLSVQENVLDLKGNLICIMYVPDLNGAIVISNLEVFVQ